MDTIVVKATTPSDNRKVVEEMVANLLNEDLEHLLAYAKEDVVKNQSMNDLLRTNDKLCAEVVAFIFVTSQRAYFYGAANAISRVMKGALEIQMIPFKKGDPK